jgi:O-antigen/teichoic acid export membrane protein
MFIHWIGFHGFCLIQHINPSIPQNRLILCSIITGNMSREFLINLIFLLIINAVIKPLYIFGIDRTVQNVVGHDYGIYFSLLSFTYLFQIINDFGLQNYNARNVSMHPRLLYRFLPGIVRLKILLAIVYVVFVFGFAWIMGYKGNYWILLAWLVVIQVFTSFLLYLRSNIAGLGYYRVDSILSVVDKLLVILICGTLLVVPAYAEKFQIEWFLMAQVASLIISICFASLFIYIKMPAIGFRSNLKTMHIILKESYPFALVYILMMIYTRIDAVMLERILPDGVSEAYTYATAYRLLDAANMLSYLFVGLLLPMFSRMLGKKEAIEPLFQTSIKILSITTACVTLPLLFFSTPIMEVLYVDGNAYSGGILRLLFIGHIFISFGHIMGALLIAEGSVRELNKIFLGGIFVNLLLNFLLIPEWKAEGAAISTLVTECVIVVGMVWLVLKKFPFLWPPKLFLKILSYGFLCGFALFTIIEFSNVSWFYLYLISLATCVVLSVLLRMLPSKEMLEVLKQNQKLKESESNTPL